MTARLDELNDERQARILTLIEETRAIRRKIEKPAQVKTRWTSGRSTTETSRYLTKDGGIREVVVDSATGKVVSDVKLIANPLLRVTAFKPAKPAPSQTVTKGAASPKIS
jgi:hypothetical protein